MLDPVKIIVVAMLATGGKTTYKGVAMDEIQVDLIKLIQASQTNHRIDVVELAKKLGLDVYSIDMPDDQCGDIRKDSKTGKFFIEINRNHPVTRQRFTVAHEIAHFLKHPEVLKQKGQLDRNNTFKDEAEIRREDEADEEAAAILMPEYLVDDYFKTKSWSNKTKFNSDMISEIADSFRVSRAMAITRLRDLEFPIPYISFA
jgi:Zn-dependent peptidase ImmA (M78 family)